MSSTTAYWRASKVSATPRKTKFSTVRKLPALEPSAPLRADSATIHSEPKRSASGSTDATAFTDTVHALRDEQRRVAEERATDRRIRCHRYAQFVQRLNTQRSLYQSTAVFVEAMLKELQHTAEAGIAMRAAAATWGLRLLAKSATHSVMGTVLEALLPALYCEYDPEKLRGVSAAVQLQVVEEDALLDNPYFTHTMFVDEVHVEKLSSADIVGALEAAVRSNDKRRHMVCHLIARQRTWHLLIAFREWRNHVRGQRLLRLLGDNTAKQRAAETSRLYAQAVFGHWRLLVERSRSAYLTERLHDAAYQLENAKNQFQLQCYRADRLVHGAKEAAAERDRVSKINEELEQLVVMLREVQAQKEKEYNQKLTQNVTQILELLSAYDSLAHLLFSSKKTSASLQTKTPVAQTSPPSGDGGEEGGEYDSEFLGNAHPDGSQESASDWFQSLRRWCDAVLSAVRDRKTPFRPIRAFTSDFANGERYLYIFRHVFTEVVPSMLSIEDMDTESRLRRIHEYATECNLRYRLTPVDFQHGREDLLVCSLSELYQRHIQRDSHRAVSQLVVDLDRFQEANVNAALVASTVSSSMEDVTESSREQLDEAIVKARIGEYTERLKGISEGFYTLFTEESGLVEASGSIAAQEARLGGERLHGVPIPLVDRVSRRAFWDLSSGALDDLRVLPQLRSEAQMWDLAVKQALPKVLQDHVDITSRLFFFFAGENARTLSEVAFWRFVEYCSVLVGRMEVPMQWITSQYDHVVTPHLDGALRVVAHGQGDMNIKKLRHVAYQEMDIRSATPTQFVELLVRIAVSSQKGAHGLVESTRLFLKELQLPTSQMSSVARELHTPESQHVLGFFNEDLLRVYLFYIKKQESSRNTYDVSLATQCGGRFASQMSLSMFFTMLGDCRFLSDGIGHGEGLMGAVADTGRPLLFVNSAQVRKLVSTLEKFSKGSAKGGLSFNLFLDTLAALAHYWCPDPLIPGPRRLAAFLSHTIQQLAARFSDSTLILGNVPTIGFEGSGHVDFNYEANALAMGGA